MIPLRIVFLAKLAAEIQDLGWWIAGGVPENASTLATWSAEDVRRDAWRVWEKGR